MREALHRNFRAFFPLTFREFRRAGVSETCPALEGLINAIFRLIDVSLTDRWCAGRPKLSSGLCLSVSTNGMDEKDGQVQQSVAVMMVNVSAICAVHDVQDSVRSYAAVTRGCRGWA